MPKKNGLYAWKECIDLDIAKVNELYAKYVNPGQLKLISSFGFGRVLVEKAQGMYISTRDGRKILDFTGGIGVLSHGHNHPRILAARIEYQKMGLMEVHKNFLSPFVVGLSHNIAKLFPKDLCISYFCNSGAEAAEGAVKLAYKSHAGDRKFILTSDISFHGKLLGSAGLTASKELTFKFPTIPNVERFRYNDINSVREKVEKLRKGNGKSDIYAIILEPFSASSLRECSKEFLEELRKICTKEGIVLIYDEVFTSWAKSGELFYFMKHGIVPDIVTYSKSFGGGKSSISGFTTRPKIFKKAYGSLQHALLHSTTYNAFGEECVTAMEAINVIVEDGYVERSKEIHKVLNRGLLDLQKKYPNIISEVRGSGALNGIVPNGDLPSLIAPLLKLVPIDFVRDPRFSQKLVVSAIISELFNSYDILTYYGDNREIPLILSPSLIVTKEEMERVLDALDKVLKQGKYILMAKFIRQKFLKRP
ncbi:MAG: aminotransferase [Omnitrophica WOR_2 bacterium GWA2_47_8]|nr:MAG: aminotransferase [Omnitrophica WOR_2 bacterium GWA2_47_8]